MAKKVVAKTNISYGNANGEQVDIVVGDEVDPKALGMTKKQLTDLYDAGAIELEETADKREEDQEKTVEETGTPVTEEPVVPGTSAPVKSESETSSPVKSTPTKATASEAKSSGKSNPT